MARLENVVTMVGNVTWGPELRYTQSGKAVADFGIAQNDSVSDGQGGFTDRPNFVTVTVWERLAENVAETVAKGTRVVVFGRLRYDEWEKDGVKSTKLTLTAEEVAPSLKWATATITKNPKGSNGSAAIPAGDIDRVLEETF